MGENSGITLQWVLQFLDKPLFRLGTTQVTPMTFVQAIVIFALVILMSMFVRRLLREKLLVHTRLDSALQYSVSRVAGYVVMVIGFLIGLQTLGFDLTSLTVVAGALGVGIGFGLQTIVHNFVSGLILLGERAIAIGDRVDVGNITGRVIRIGARSTSVLTNDNIVVIVPNSEFINGRVINWSHAGDMRVRLRIPVGVSYNCDPKRVETLILEAATEEPTCLKDPAPTVAFTGFGESSIDFELRAWTSELTHRPGAFRSNMYHRIWVKFKEHNIEIPFPQRDLHVKGNVHVKMDHQTQSRPT